MAFDRPFDPIIDELNTRLRHSPPQTILQEALRQFAGKIALVSSFGSESAVLLHMISQIDPTLPILFLDTGQLFGQTLDYRKSLARRLALTDVRDLRPSFSDLATRDPKADLWKTDVDGCCEIRKVLPLDRAIRPEFDAWITGRKRFQSSTRANLPVVERGDGDKIKFNPLANWTKADLDAYAAEYDLPVHPLTAFGYPSIGCWPCTKPVEDGADERSGRWSGSEKTECGYTFPALRAAPPTTSAATSNTVDSVMTDSSAALAGGSASVPAPTASYHVQTVIWVKHWTDQYFSFAITRPPSFRFRSGEFVMIGLPGEDGKKPILRAYSIASPAFEDELEFFSIKVADGPLTSRLQKIQPGDSILMAKKATGTLVLDALTPGKRLFLIGTGTGLAPWLSVARDPDAYERFEKVIVCHTVRETIDLAYRDLFERDLIEHELFGEYARNQLLYYPTVTRQPFKYEGRITDRIRSGALFKDLGLQAEQFNPAEDRVMICGAMAMIKDVAEILESQGLKEGSNAEPGDFVLERAFVG